MGFLPRHDMDMGSGSGSSSHQSSMSMVFQTDQATPLYSTAWTPQTSGSYAGTCIFLVVLAALARALVALRATQEHRWYENEKNRRYIAVKGKGPLAEEIAAHPEAKKMTVASSNGPEEDVVVVEQRRVNRPQPWRFSVDPVRAVLDTVIVGVGYLLMLAVMTMNVGYFMSVLAGVFVGSLALGRFAPGVDH